MKKLLCFILSLILCTVFLAFPSMAYEPACLGFNSYEDYWQYINENSLPDTFVYYESLSMFGEFEMFSFICDDPGCDECMYEYQFRCEYGFSVIIQVLPGDEVDIWDNYKLINVETDNLRFSKVHSYYVLSEAVYYYDRQGELCSIYWVNNGHIFTLCDHNNRNVFPRYSTEATNIIGKLLNKNTAPEVIELLKTHDFLGKPEAPIPPETADNSIIFSVLSVISAGGFTLFASKKPKKKRS